MFNDSIIHCIQHLPANAVLPREIDIVLSGGAFNGSYMLGCLYYIKELEKQNKIRVKRISGSSIGSVLGLLYFADKLDIFNELYKSSFDDVLENLNFSKLLKLKHILKDKLPIHFYEIVHKKLYITYHNVQSCVKCTKRTFKDNNVLFDSIIRSCYLPFLINYQPAYKGKYIDGMLPYFFKQQDHRKVLYINVFTYDKMNHSISVKNENTNVHRILIGLYEMHLFFIKCHNTFMCSYLDRWSFYEYFNYLLCLVLEKMVLYTICLTKDIFNIQQIQWHAKHYTQQFIQFLLSL